MKKVIFSVIAVLLIIELGFVFYKNKHPKVPAPDFGNFGNHNTDDRKNYENKEFGFSFKYPKEDKMLEQTNYEFITENSLVGVALPDSYYQGTNLGEAIFSVGASSSKAVLDKCLNTNQGETKSGQKDVDGETFQVFKSVGAAAGNRYDTTSYRTIRDNTCYEINLLMHYGVIENYPPGSVQEFNQEETLKKLNTILESFRFKN